jgi:hypothetical protein
MHFKNGRVAQNGDKVMLIPTYGPPVVGILYDAQAGNDYCNGHIAPISPNDPCPNLKECLHLDDALALLNAPDSSKPAGEPENEYPDAAIDGRAEIGDATPDS